MIENEYPELDADKVMTALFAIMFGASQAGNAAALGPDAGKASGAAKKIFRIIEQESKIDAIKMDEDGKKSDLDVSTLKGKIEFKDVWFRYPTRKEEFVLRGLNLVINPGESVALVGESGCGKSTFVNLMMRFYDPEYGTILLDDRDIKTYNLHELRTAISLVMQEPIVFNYTILENILYGKTDATNTEILEACQKANCLEFIEKSDMAEGDIATTAVALIEYM